MLSAVVHGLLQSLHSRFTKPDLALAGAALAGGVALHPLGQNLLQGQDISLQLLRLRQELAQNVPGDGEEISLINKRNINCSSGTAVIWLNKL